MVYQDIYSPDPISYSTPPKRPSPTPLQRPHRPSPLTITPPSSFQTPYKTHQFSPSAYDHSSPYFTPGYSVPDVRSRGTYAAGELSPTSSAASSPGPLTPTRIFMGGIVSPRCSEDEWDEKIGLSIEVPGIVLTEPTNPTRTPSPQPKTILLLPPTSLNLPSTDPTSPSSPFYTPYSPPSTSSPTSSTSLSSAHGGRQLFSPAFQAIIYGDQRSRTGVLGGLGISTTRTVVFGLMMLLGAWHLWLNFQVGEGTGGWREGSAVIERM